MKKVLCIKKATREMAFLLLMIRFIIPLGPCALAFMIPNKNHRIDLHSRRKLENSLSSSQGSSKEISTFHTNTATNTATSSSSSSSSVVITADHPRPSSSSSSNSNSSNVAMSSDSVLTLQKNSKEIQIPKLSISQISSSPIKKQIFTSTIPGWFPYIPTRSQIDTLKLNELKDACYERGLSKNGNKDILQKRLLQWTNDQHTRRVLERNVVLPSNKYISSHSTTSTTRTTLTPIHTPLSHITKTTNLNVPSSTLAENDIIDPLIHRRKELLRNKSFSFSKSKGTLGLNRNPKSSKKREPKWDDMEKEEADELEEVDEEEDEEEMEETEENERDFLPMSSSTKEEYLSHLQKTFDQEVLATAPNNYQIQKLYLDSKHADQAGNVPLAKMYLYKILQVTPKDTRVIRRLSRLEMEEGNMEKAREILQSGLRYMPLNADLLHGLGSLELKCNNIDGARNLFKKAIKSRPTYANPYHALATMEHSQGNIRIATAVLRAGLTDCPSNHRLHHALGDLYRDAKMLDMAEKEYRKGIKCLEAEEGRTRKDLSWSKSFFYTGLSYISYEIGNKNECRQWLRKSVEGNNQMHSQGWLGLAQLEESEGNIEAARNVYNEALAFYEKKRGIQGSLSSSYTSTSSKMHRPKLGDQWRKVYESWASMEEEHGNFSAANNIYSRGAIAFPKEWDILLLWARFQQRHGKLDRARTLFKMACDVAGSSEAKPFVSYADFEISLGNFHRARSILFLGAQSLAESLNGSLQNEGLAKLYHSWAVCEWHLGNNLDRVETLFDHGLRVTDSGPNGAGMRSLIMYSLARFLYHARKEYSLAQHCVCLSLSENITPGGDVGIWILWSHIAKAMCNENLQKLCIQQADTLDKEMNDAIFRLSSNMLRKAPWQYKMLRLKNNHAESWYKEITFPESMNE